VRRVDRSFAYACFTIYNVEILVRRAMKAASTPLTFFSSSIQPSRHVVVQLTPAVVPTIEIMNGTEKGHDG